MLGKYPIGVVLLATDLKVSRDFYKDKVGLKIKHEDDRGVSFKCGGESTLTVTASTTGTADEQTQASWYVDDLAKELAELRGRGVKIMDYDLPGLKTKDGVADIGFALAAWFVDPGKNSIGILQYK